MKIRLRVAGIYFNRELIVPPNADGTPITILNAMNYIQEALPIEKEGGFKFEPHNMSPKGTPDFLIVTMFSHFFSGNYDFNGDGKITPAKDNQGKTLGGNTRQCGLYALKSGKVQDSPTIITAWQYYVRENNGNGRLRSRTEPDSGGFTSFDKFELKDHDELTWRLVTIQKDPTIKCEDITPESAFSALRYL